MMSTSSFGIPAIPVTRAWRFAAHRLWIASCAAVFALGCGSFGGGVARTELGQQVQSAPHSPQEAGHYAVATAHPIATRAAVQMLERGGSAIDALVAASLALSVVTPQSTGIGGGGFAVVVPAQGPPRAFDFRESAPAATQLSDYLDASGKLVAARSQRHGLAVAIPGYLPGLRALHQRWGRLPWADTVQPAIIAAEQGFVVGSPLHAALVDTWPQLSPAARATFGRGDQPVAVGETLRWPALAQTLRTLAQDPQALEKGPIAEEIAATAQSAGGKLSPADLSDYRVREMAPLQGEAFGHLVYTMPQPSAGGAQVLAMAEFLQAWQGQSPRKLPYSLDADFAAHALAEAMRRSFVLRLAYSADPPVPATLLDQVYPPAARASLLPWNPRTLTPTSSLPPLPSVQLEQHANTSHVAIRDGDGLAVSSTHTVNLLFGSGLVAPRSGVLLNNEMDDFSFNTQDSNAFGLAGSAANLARPGARPVSSMAPLVVMAGPAARPESPWMVLGSPGGTRIPTAVLQVLFRVAHSGWSLAQAVAAPRLHHQALPDAAWVEAGAPALTAALRAHGHEVRERPAWCNVQGLVAVHAEGGTMRWHAVADPRGEGQAAVR